MRLAIIAVGLLVAGCVTAPVAIRENKYKIMFGAHSAYTALQNANTFCASQGRRATVTYEGVEEVEFFCLAPGERLVNRSSTPAPSGGMICVPVGDIMNCRATP